MTDNILIEQLEQVLARLDTEIATKKAARESVARSLRLLGSSVDELEHQVDDEHLVDEDLVEKQHERDVDDALRDEEDEPAARPSSRRSTPAKSTPAASLGEQADDQPDNEITMTCGNGHLELVDGSNIAACIDALRTQPGAWMTPAGILEVMRALTKRELPEYFSHQVQKIMRRQRHEQTFRIPGLEARGSGRRWEYRMHGESASPG